VIETCHLTKRYGSKTAVDDLTIRVQPGQVTGFLGPNGAGKSTTMRLILGLDHPSSGTATVNGQPYALHKDPLHQVGALLDARATHPGRTARDHLRVMASTQGIPTKRADELLEMTGLAPAAGRRVGTFSLGMTQRLGIAVALLADPMTLILDEPVTGLDPEGVMWVRNLLRVEAQRGKTIFLSSHLMSEMQQVADHLVILGRGRLLAEKSMAAFINDASGCATRVVTPEAARLRDALTARGAAVAEMEPGVLRVTGLSTADVGECAARQGCVLHELTPLQASLEDAYMKITESAAEFAAHDPKEVAS